MSQMMAGRYDYWLMALSVGMAALTWPGARHTTSVHDVGILAGSIALAMLIDGVALTLLFDAGDVPVFEEGAGCEGGMDGESGWKGK